MSDTYQPNHGPITEEKLVRAVHILADIVESKGSAFRPLYQDLRQQLADLRQRQQADAAATDRAFRESSKVA